MMVTTGGRGTASPQRFFAGSASATLFRRLLFEGDHVGFGAEEARHFAGQFGVERLVDGGEHAARQQTRDQIFRANFQLLGQILHADALGDGDVARDRQRLVRKRQPRRRNIALHRAFLHPARNVTLSGTRDGPPGRLPGRMVPEAAEPPGPTPSGRAPVGDCARRMHGTTLARTQRRTGPRPAARRTRALENRLARHRTAGRRTRSRQLRARRGSCGRGGGPCKPDAAGLRHDHARRRRRGRRRLAAGALGRAP